MDDGWKSYVGRRPTSLLPAVLRELCSQKYTAIRKRVNPRRIDAIIGPFIIVRSPRAVFHDIPAKMNFPRASGDTLLPVRGVNLKAHRVPRRAQTLFNPLARSSPLLDGKFLFFSLLFFSFLSRWQINNTASSRRLDTPWRRIFGSIGKYNLPRAS